MVTEIGDTHGRDYWKEVWEKEGEKCEKFIFIADYFDSWDVEPVVQIHNFKEILELKRENPDKVVLLIGNHDFHYLNGVNETYSGYKDVTSFDANLLLEGAIAEGLMQMCYIHGKHIFTHAGVSKTWLMNVGYNKEKLDDYINELFIYKRGAFKFEMGINFSQTGDDVTQSPIWIRPRSLMKDGVDGYIQVVGHTSKEDITQIGNFIFTDCLDNKNNYLKLDI